MKDLLFFFRLFRPYRMWLVSGVLLSLLAAFASIGLLTLSGWFITASAVAGLSAPDGVALTFNFLLPSAQIRALAIVRTIGRYAERMVTHEATFRILARIRVWFFSRLIPLAPAQVDNVRGGEILSRMTADIDALDALYLRFALPILMAVVGIPVITTFIYIYAPSISLALLVMLLLAGVLVPTLFNRIGQKPARESVVQSARLRTCTIDFIQGFTDLIAYRAEDRYRKAAVAVSDQYIDSQMKNNQLSAWSSSLTLLVSQLSIILVLMIGAGLFQTHQFTGPVLAMLIFCTAAVFELIAPLPLVLQLMGKIQNAASRIREVAEMPPMIIDPGFPKAIPKTLDLSIQQMSFRYPDRDQWILQDINLTIPQGSRIAIVGRSGAGKTSLLHLLMRNYDPQNGVLSIGGINYQQLNSKDLTTRFGLLSQQTRLFAGTIGENILLGNPKATRQEINLAIHAAGLGQLIQHLPEGLNAWVGENGLKVSGGEARRIALARVYLKNAPILLLDEPTEGLDFDTEKVVLKALESFAVDKTVVLVTHRKTGLHLVDNIYRLEKTHLTRK